MQLLSIFCSIYVHCSQLCGNALLQNFKKVQGKKERKLYSLVEERGNTLQHLTSSAAFPQSKNCSRRRSDLNFFDL